MKIFELAKGNFEMAKAELESFFKIEKIDDNLVFIDNSVEEMPLRFAYTNATYDLIFSSNLKNIYSKIEKTNWKRIVKETYAIKCDNEILNKNRIYNVIYEKTPKANVNLEEPKTLIRLFKRNEEIHCCILIEKNKKEFLLRQPHFHAVNHPTTMDPRLAIACINLLGKKNGMFLDPFCGAGGFLIEAHFLGHEIKGYDIDIKQINNAKKNLDYYNIYEKNLVLGDATKSELVADLVVSDLPYGRSSKGNALEKLYSNFLQNARRYQNKIVIIFPDAIFDKKLIENSGWYVEKLFSYYVHKSLTRKITLLKKI